MADIVEIIKGIGLFIAGFFSMIVLDRIIPELITAGEAIFPSVKAQTLTWLLVILIWVGLGIILPSVKVISAIRTKTKNDNKTMNVILAIGIFLVSIIATIELWSWTTTLSALSSTGLVKAIFWIGLILMWTQITIITPTYLIINTLQE